MSRNWFALGAILLLLVMAGCSKDHEVGYVYDPISQHESTPFTLSFSLELTGYADGDPVYLGGSVLKEWTPENPNILIQVGTVESCQINISYERMVMAAGEDYTATLFVEHAGYKYRELDGIVACGDTLTDLRYTPFDVLREFCVTRQDGNAAILQNDEDHLLMNATLQYTGCAFTDPDLVYLNESLAQPILTLSTWSRLNLLPNEWDEEDEIWTQDITVVKGSTIYLRWQDESGQERRAGCYIGDLECRYLVDLDSRPDYEWWVFEVRVTETGEFENPGDDNRWVNLGIE